MARTGTNSTAIKMIPKPDKVSTLFKPSQERDSLSFQMRLSGSPEKVNMYCEIIEKVAQLIDGYKPAVSGPRERGQWQTFLKHVTKKCPILQKYEDAWPVHKKPVQVKGTLSTPKPPAAELHLDRPDTDTESEPPTSSGRAATEQSGLARSITRDLSAKTANILDETQVTLCARSPGWR
ncbi:hypothetical protein C8T65DRAFT_751277 [Cerioporus squamosus]|nr:hypothetical protein C8T65DRAFT_751277 [Cerioporus squamosus]